MGKRFFFLRFIANMYEVVGSLIMAGAILIGGFAFIMSVAGGTASSELAAIGITGAIGSILITLYFFILGAGIFAIGQLIEVFLSIEENTWTTADLLRRRMNASKTGKLNS